MPTLLGNHWVKPPALARHDDTACLSCLTIRVPIRNAVQLQRTNQENPGGAERRRTRYVLPTSQKPSRWNPSWLRDARATREDPESDQIRAKEDDGPETTWKRTPVPWNLRLQATWQSSSPGAPNSAALHPGGSFPVKSFALSARESPRTIHFPVLDESPHSGLGRGPSSCDNTILLNNKAYSVTLLSLNYY